MMWYWIKYLQCEALGYCSLLTMAFSQLIFFLNPPAHQIKKRHSFTFLNRIDTRKVFKFCFPFRRNRNIDLYVITFWPCHFFLHASNYA